jgi:hypothetical protein
MPFDSFQFIPIKVSLLSSSTLPRVRPPNRWLGWGFSRSLESHASESRSSPPTRFLSARQKFYFIGSSCDSERASPPFESLSFVLYKPETALKDFEERKGAENSAFALLKWGPPETGRHQGGDCHPSQSTVDSRSWCRRLRFPTQIVSRGQTRVHTAGQANPCSRRQLR